MNEVDREFESQLISASAILSPFNEIDKILGNEIYNVNLTQQFSRDSRESEVLLDGIPRTVVVIGVGGIGAWVAQYLSGINGIHNLILIDPDQIELTNLNRTPFNYEDVGELKVNAIANLISKRNAFITVIPLARYFNESLLKEVSESTIMADLHNAGNVHGNSIKHNGILFIDCRDNYFNDYDLFYRFAEDNWNFSHDEVLILRAAYDNTSITLDFSPENHPVMGQGGYTVQPSNIIPASLVALLVCIMAGQYWRYKSLGDTLAKHIFNNPMTFNIDKIIDMLFVGNFVCNKMNNSPLQDLIKDMIVGDRLELTEEDRISLNPPAPPELQETMRYRAENGDEVILPINQIES